MTRNPPAQPKSRLRRSVAVRIDSPVCVTGTIGRNGEEGVGMKEGCRVSGVGREAWGAYGAVRGIAQPGGTPAERPGPPNQRPPYPTSRQAADDCAKASSSTRRVQSSFLPTPDTRHPLSHPHYSTHDSSRSSSPVATGTVICAGKGKERSEKTCIIRSSRDGFGNGKAVSSRRTYCQCKNLQPPCICMMPVLIPSSCSFLSWFGIRAQTKSWAQPFPPDCSFVGSG